MRKFGILLLLFPLAAWICNSARAAQDAGAAKAQASSIHSPDGCALLESDEIRAVQGEPVRETKNSRADRGQYIASQCFYRAESFTNSVSLMLVAPSASHPQGARAYWEERFHASRAAARPGSTPATVVSEQPAPKKKDPPQPVPGVGEEAFWVGDRVAGSLYVLQGDVFLRLSVGGAGDEKQKLERCKKLAQHALRRLATHLPS